MFSVVLRPGQLVFLFAVLVSVALHAAVPVVESVPVPVTATEAPEASVTAEAKQTVSLKYDAYVAGIPAGDAQLTLERQPLPARGAASFSYKVAGTARSKGLWESIQKWRAE